MAKPKDLVVLDRCRKQLAEISDLPTLKEIRDQAKALADYHRTKDGGFEISNRGKSIMSLAEARMGQTLIEMKANGKLADQGGDRAKSHELTLLSDLGISKNESSRMQTAAKVLEEDPDWFDEHVIECNEEQKDFTQQSVVRRGREIQNAETGKKKPKTPRGKYDVIVIDPPWPMQKIEREVRPNQAAFEYPVMQEDEIAQLKMPAAEDCHMWCWTTHKFLPMALRLIPQWGFKYICAFVWHKAGGFQPVGLPQYNCEFALYCRKGSPKFHTTKQLFTCFDAPRGKHSEKPEEFYDTVRSVTRGKRLDMFNRRQIKGFQGWGNESKVQG